ncbi:MAG: hypothetical protein KDA24_27490, partial [Deltaproteobacteria bacterium]|nr:hypothetical protein [Deltaproteobacteria bacterium]
GGAGGGGTGGSGGGDEFSGDDWGDSGGGGGGSSRGLADNYSRASGRAPGRAGAEGDGIMRASKQGRSGVHTLGEGDGAVTVYSPGENEQYKGSAKYDRDIEARKAANEREADRRRWEKRQQATWEEEGGPGGSGGGPNLTVLLLLVLLVAAGAVGARAVMGGS